MCLEKDFEARPCMQELLGCTWLQHPFRAKLAPIESSRNVDLGLGFLQLGAAKVAP